MKKLALDMKKLTFILIAVISLLLMSCEDFLDTTNYTKKNTSNFPRTLDDAQQMITGIYSTLNLTSSHVWSSYFQVAQLASDDCLGGSGENGKQPQAIDLLMKSSETMLTEFWADRYSGIFRANLAIESLDKCEGFTSETQKNQMKGEAYFMRALFYYEMATIIGEVPLITATEPVNLPKASSDEIFGLIASDLKNAINLLPSTPYTGIEVGHATKWAAEALMARSFLFYTGFYNKDSMPILNKNGSLSGSISKSEVISWIEDCINNSGHTLVEDYRELWSYTNRYTVEDYEYTKGQGLEWIENDGAINPETLFAIKYSNFASQSGNVGYSNQYALYYGFRGGQKYEDTFPFGQGWGMGPANPGLWTDWLEAEPNDPRREATLINIPVEVPNYTKGGWSLVQETDYWQKKIMPISAKIDENTYASSYSVLMYETEDNFQLSNTMDIVLIRLADVYLMHSELTQTNTYMNLVRERAGLPAKEYSLENLQNERRWEMACEGIRWNDIRRWGIASEVLQKQVGQPVYTKGVPDINKSFGGGYAARYNETQGFFPIPEPQILLSDGVLKQTEGWDIASALYSGWK